MAKATDIVKRWQKQNAIQPLEKKSDVEKVLKYYGFEIRQGSGSHEIIVSHEKLQDLDFGSMGVGKELSIPLKSGKMVKNII